MYIHTLMSEEKLILRFENRITLVFSLNLLAMLFCKHPYKFYTVGTDVLHEKVSYRSVLSAAIHNTQKRPN